MFYRVVFKRSMDLTLALLAFILTFPLFIVLTFGLAVSNLGKPFFLQARPGKDGKIFNIIKFKTMSDCKDSRGNLLPDEQRLTKLGKIIRKLSLDEIPQLINVIKGEMSLVGPRPLLVEYLRLYNKMQARRHDVRPGITGLAQVNGRNSVSWDRKFEMDIWYVENYSFKVDLMILYRTVGKVFRREGVSAEGHVTAEKFDGNE